MARASAQTLSWGRTSHFDQDVSLSFWRSDIPALLASERQRQVLAHGLGRSYGDSCLLQHGRLIDCSPLNRLIQFDRTQGILTCEAGTSLADILRVIVPAGWFLPVVPGTKFVTIGGAIANDIHGKNHHIAGTFGRHVRRFELWRRDRPPTQCSPQENADLFRATIGGLGLTGLIAWAEIQLVPIATAQLDVEIIRYAGLEDFFQLCDTSETSHAYTVAWIDCLASGSALGRGHFIRGNHCPSSSRPALSNANKRALNLSIPFDAPSGLLNSWTIKAFNNLYYKRLRQDHVRLTQGFDPFFFPLDRILGWNRLYGKRGLFQYQCVVPTEEKNTVKRLFELISAAQEGSFLGVLKRFGDAPSPGMLSFPQPGYTISLDFANRGASTRRLFAALDAEVLAAGGRIYPAKDAHMTPEMFQRGFPQWEAFQKWIDPGFSSSFWQRVMGHGT